MRKRGKMVIALAISMPLMLLGGGLAVAADQFTGLQNATEGDWSTILSGGSRLSMPCILRAGFTDSTRTQAGEWCRVCTQDHDGNCGEECYVAGACPVDCPLVAEGESLACCKDGNTGKEFRECCRFRDAPPVETTQSAGYSGCSRCDSEPLNEYPPNSPWYTGNS